MIKSDWSARSDLPELVRCLKSCNRHVTIETAGIAYVPDLPCDLMSISPKLSNATPAETKNAELREDSRLNSAVLRDLIDNYQYQLKFVVDSKEDLAEIRRMIKQAGNVDLNRVMLMPQAKSREEFLAKAPMIAQLCKAAGFVFGHRLQVLLWNGQKGN